MYLYHSTIQAPSSIPACARGTFITNIKSNASIRADAEQSLPSPLQQLVVSRGSGWLEVLQLHPETGKLNSLWQQNVFCTIHSLTTVRLPEEDVDLLVLGTDSGRLVILRAVIMDTTRSLTDGSFQWQVEHRGTFGRSGVRRTIAGEYVASDPRGRAVMVAAIERQKLVWQLTRSTENLQEQTFGKEKTFTVASEISSPLEASKSNVIVFGVVGIDGGLAGNPQFAALEVDTSNVDAGDDRDGVETIQHPSNLVKQLVYYEVDIGINHVTRRVGKTVGRTANWLMPLPCHTELAVPSTQKSTPSLVLKEDAPGGVLVGEEGILSWYRPGYQATSCAIPIRSDAYGHGHDDNQKAENQETIVHDGRQANNGLVRRRPTIIVNGCVLPSREQELFVLVQTEEGDLFRVYLRAIDGKSLTISLTYYDTIPVATSLQLFSSGFLFVAAEHTDHRLYQVLSLGEAADASNGAHQPNSFYRHAKLVNLSLTDRLDSLSGITAAQILSLPSSTEGEPSSPIIICAQGSTHHSQLRALQLGIPITSVATTVLPQPASQVWTLKSLQKQSHFDSFIVISMPNSTIVLKVVEATVEEAQIPNDINLLSQVATIALGQLFDGSHVQVHAGGVRQVRPNGRVGEWKCPTGSGIQRATLNQRQVILILDTNILVHLEADATGYLLETGQTPPLNFIVQSLAVGSVPVDRLRCRFLAIGSGSTKSTGKEEEEENMAVRIICCDPGEEFLQPLSVQALAATPVSLSMNYDLEEGGLLLHVGLENGVLCQLRIDGSTGTMRDARTRYLGAAHPVHCYPGDGEFSLMALSYRPWVRFRSHGRHHFTPLASAGAPWRCVVPFASLQCPTNGFLAISEDSQLHIFMLESTATRLAGPALPLSQTPRRMAHDSELDLLAIVESDHRNHNQHRDNSVEDEGECLLFAEQWNSSIRLVRPSTMETLAIHHLSQNEAATCCAFVTFHDHPTERYLAVGVAKDMRLMPRGATASAILLFQIHYSNEEGSSPLLKLSLAHSTIVSEIPSACCAFGGRLLCSVGNTLRLYDLGRKQLLRKCEVKLPSFATTLATQGWRVFVGDNQYSLLLYQYSATNNRFILVADDMLPRPVTALLPLDYETVAMADRAGCFSVLRLSAMAAQEVESDGIFSGTGTMASGGTQTKNKNLFGAPHKLERLAEFYLGETIVSLNKICFGLSCRELIIYTTLSGAVGYFLPITQRSDALLLQSLEVKLRTQLPATLLGRNLLLFRSYYAAVKSVIDGDLCELFNLATGEIQNAISQQLDRLPSQIVAKLEDLRTLAGI